MPLVGSVSFIGIGMMTAVLPLISPEKGTQLGFMAQRILLVISGVYYPVSVLPDWMQVASIFSPATYALDGLRDAILRGGSLTEMGDELWPLVLIGAVTIRSRCGSFDRRGLREAAREAEAVGMRRPSAASVYYALEFLLSMPTWVVPPSISSGSWSSRRWSSCRWGTALAAAVFVLRAGATGDVLPFQVTAP